MCGMVLPKSVNELCYFKAARKDKSAVPSAQETVKNIIRGQVGYHINLFYA